MMNLYTKQNDIPSELPVANAVPKPVKASFEKYVDPTGEFSSKDLGYSIWYVHHRVGIYRLLIGSLVTVIIVLWGYSLWQWGDYLIFGLASDNLLEKQASQAVDYIPAEQHFTATALQILSTDIFPGGVNKYDAVSEVGNPNENFLARGTYYYIVDGVKTEARSFFILPGESSLLNELGIESSGSPSEAQLVIESMSWKRISTHQVKDPKSWQEARLSFSLNDFLFTPLASASGAKANVITFSLVNESPYGYVVPHFYVGLYNQEALVGVLPLSFEKLASLETKKVDLRNFVDTLSASSAKIFPLINVYDSSVYLPPVK